jgi:hypothetical protein
MFEFSLYTWLIAGLALGAMLWALLIKGDVFHPLAILMPMVLFTYVYLPYELISTNTIELAFFKPEQWARVQMLNMLCVATLIAGCLLGSGRGWPHERPQAGEIPARPTGSVFAYGLFLGGLGLVAFAVNVNNVGGLFEAYSVEKGGGTAEIGYVRDAIFWVLPAIALVAYCLANDGPQPRYLIAIGIFATPLLIHGLLGARRGPTFMITAALAASWYLARRRRPNLLLFAAGALLLGMVLLAIVTFREQFRIGSDLMTDTIGTVEKMTEEFSSRRGDTLNRTVGSHEFVYGANVMLTFEDKQDYFWGKRLLTIMFIRPIPKQLWPTKYEDVGMERYKVNVGLGTGEDMLMTSSAGAAPGFVADLFAEFSWGAILACFLVGLGYSAAWRGAVYGNGLALVLYILLVGLSIFFVLQTLEAILYRLMLTAVPVVLAWRWIAPVNLPDREPVEVPEDAAPTPEAETT